MLPSYQCPSNKLRNEGECARVTTAQHWHVCSWSQADVSASHGLRSAKCQSGHDTTKCGRHWLRATAQRYALRKANRSALIVSACVVGMP